MGKLSFPKLILEAYSTTFTRKLPWIFGSFIAFSSLVESKINTDITNASSFEELFQIIIQKSPQELWYVFLILFGLFILNTLGKGNLIVSLSFITNKNHLSHYPITPRAIWKNFVSLFLLECIAFIFLILILGVLSLPFLIASKTNPATLPILLNFALLTFIPLAFIVSLVKQFTFLYVLLSPLKIRTAIEAGSSLFSKFMTPSLIFSFLTLLLTVLFTFFVNLVILGITVFSEKISLAQEALFLSFVVSFILFTWFALFLQALWITFFKSIALPQEPQKIIEEEVIIERSALPEVPPAQ